MVEPQTIKNPVLRMVTGAAAAFSIATLVSGAVVGWLKPQDEATHKWAVSTSLVSTGCGALLGLVLNPKQQGASDPEAKPEQLAYQPWTGWRDFVVVRKVKESEDITSFYLQPADQATIPNFQPGQFLTIKLDIPGQSKPTIRTYSLSDYADPRDYYRLSIKREPMSSPEVPPGLASNFMHDQVQEGSVIQAKPPSGKFVLDPAKSSPVILVSNGVGITPMISMAQASTRLNPDRPLWFIHGARDGTFHAFRDEVLAMAQQHSHLQVHFRYSRPRPEDMERHHSTGYVDAALIREIVGQGAENRHEAEYYLCGSPPFLQSLRDGFTALGIPMDRVFFEVFGGAAGQSMAARESTTTRADIKPANGKVQSAEVVFAKTGTTLTWQPGDGTLLEFAEAHDLNPEYSCRQGICLTCMCRLEAGEVDYVQPPVGTPETGSVLICISQPKTSRVVLDL